MNTHIDKIIRLGDVASEVGDYKFAIQNFSKALEKIKSSGMDNLETSNIQSDLNKKINSILDKKGNDKPVLKYENWLLSKSSFVKGNQCLKYLFLDKYKKTEKTPPNRITQKLFEQGHSFEDQFRTSEFPNGINIKEKVGDFFYFNSYTKFVLSQSKQITLFEATFIEDNVLVMCDVVDKIENKKFDFYEVKLHTELNTTLINDLAIQYYVCKKRFQDNINTFNIVLRNNNKIKEWKVIDMKSELEGHLDNVKVKIDAFDKILLDKNKEPSIALGKHCNSPYYCEYIRYCKDKQTPTIKKTLKNLIKVYRSILSKN